MVTRFLILDADARVIGGTDGPVRCDPRGRGSADSS